MGAWPRRTDREGVLEIAFAVGHGCAFAARLSSETLLQVIELLR